MASELLIGLMSGTSVDGIDAVIVEFESTAKLKVIETQFTPFSSSTRNAINKTALNNSTLKKNEDSDLHIILAKYYAEASLNILKKAGLNINDISAVANHGQTVKHEPNASPAYSLQLGCGQLIANLTGAKTITQFRQADMACGGQGAPLMPAFHKAVFSNSNNTFILNLGGIANITRLGSSVVGFDTGPGNTLLDQWIGKHQNQLFDQNGEWANSGTVNEELLSRLMVDKYIQLPFPKSTGTDYYNLDWLNTLISDLNSYAPNDVQATLLSFTVKTIQLALEQLNVSSGDIFVCGGGAHNLTMMSSLQKSLSDFTVTKTDDIGVPADWVEAVGFAWLGYCYLNNIPSNLPTVTGANRQVVLGEQFLPEL